MSSIDKAVWRVVSPLLDKALELEPPERESFLAELARKSPALTELIHELLDNHEQLLASTFLQTPLDRPGDPQATLAGCRVGAYTLERPIGAGGMGVVWLARRSDGRFEGFSAVKLLHLAILDRLGEERFRREGSLLARLSHPNIARLLDAGVTAAGQPYLVLEHVEGQRIDRYAAEHRLSIDARLDLCLQVADAVAHAHANLVVHRDIKPSNILVDSARRAKLLDFGIATIIDEKSTLTVGGRPLTPEYAAPEQAAGGAITTATDVYSVGVLLYQLLVGRHPTAADGASDALILRNLVEVNPPRLSEAAARLRADTPRDSQLLAERATTRERLIRACRGDLDTILAKALKKNPAERYQTVAALADDLRRYRRREPVAARPDSAWYRWRKLAARHRVELGAAAAVAVALLIGMGVAIRQARLSARERDRALEQLRRAEAMNDLNGFLLSLARPGTAPISNAELLARGEAVIERRFAGDAVLRAHMQLMLADRYFENQQFDAWRRLLGRAEASANESGDPALGAQMACAAAAVLIEQQQMPEALAKIEGAQRRVVASERADVAAECARLESRAAGRAGDSARALQAAKRAADLEVGRRAPINRVMLSVQTLASAHTALGNYAEADTAYQRVQTLIQQQGLDRTLEYAVFLNNWSAMLQGAGQHRAAAGLAGRAVRIAREADSENGASLTMLTTWASALSATGDFGDATAALDEALIKSRQAGSASRLFNTLGQAVIVATEAGDVPRATSLFAEAEHAFRPDSPPLQRAAFVISAGRLALASGNPGHAIEMSRRALELLAAASPTQASLLPTEIFLARSLNAGAHFNDALEYAERSLVEGRKRSGGFRHSSTIGSALLEQATALRGLGRLEQARTAVSEALDHLNETLGPTSMTVSRARQLRSVLTTDRQ